MLTVSTVNVNGLRAAVKKGFVEWLATTKADVVACQEVRAEAEQLPASVVAPDGWFAAHAASSVKGRNGVSIYSRVEPDEVRTGFGEAEFENSGRYLEMHLPNVVVASLYLPSGDVGTERQEEKERFMAAFLPYLADLRAKSAVDGREVVVAGDWNIAYDTIDLKNWRGNRKNSGFLPEERAWLGRVYDEAGYVDVQRRLDPEGPGPYTWWSYRGQAFDNDSGWRIDCQLATPGLAAQCTSVVVERAAAYDQRWSDHAPVTATYDVEFPADAVKPAIHAAVRAARQVALSTKWLS